MKAMVIIEFQVHHHAKRCQKKEPGYSVLFPALNQAEIKQ